MPRPPTSRRRENSPSAAAQNSPSSQSGDRAGAASARGNRTAAKRFVVLIGLAVVAISGAAWYSMTAKAQADRARLLNDASRDSPAGEQALAAFLKQHPDDAEACEVLVAWHLRTQSPLADFEVYLNRLCELRPTDADPLRTRAILRARDGRPEEAVVDGLRALELLPSDETTRRIVATAAAEAGQYDVAIREAQRLVDDSRSPTAEQVVLLVKAHLAASDAAGAERAFSRHFPASAAPADRDALWVQVLQAAKRHAEAATVLRSLADSSREYREFALSRLAQSLAALERQEDAKKVLAELESVKARARKVVDANQRPDDKGAQWIAGQVLIEDGEFAKATALLETACRRHGADATAARLLARAYRGLGQEAVALEWERTAERHE